MPVRMNECSKSQRMLADLAVGEWPGWASSCAFFFSFLPRLLHRPFTGIKVLAKCCLPKMSLHYLTSCMPLRKSQPQFRERFWSFILVVCNQSALSWSAQYDCQGVLQNLEYVPLHNGSIIDVFAIVGEIHARSHLFTSHLEALAAGAQVAVHRDLPT